MHARLKILKTLPLSTRFHSRRGLLFLSNSRTFSNCLTTFCASQDYFAPSNSLLPLRCLISFVSFSTKAKYSGKLRSESDAEEEVLNSRLLTTEAFSITVDCSKLVAEEKTASLDVSAVPSLLPEHKPDDGSDSSARQVFATAASSAEASTEVSETAECLSKQSFENDRNSNIKDLESVSGADGCVNENIHVDGWNMSYRQRVEKILADKGFVGKSKVLCQDFSGEVPAEQVNGHGASQSYENSQDSLPFTEASSIGGDKNANNGSKLDRGGVSLGWEAEEQPAVLSSGKGEIEKEKHASEMKLPSTTFSKQSSSFHKDEELGLKSSLQASALLRAALDESYEEESDVAKENQRSLEVGIVGAPNSGKSTLLNHLIGTKVSAVSRKTNTTRSEILGVLTEADTQLLFYDTPGLMLDWRGQALRQDMKNRVQSAWMTVDHCDLLLVLVDAHRHIEKPDPRVQRLIEKLGMENRPPQTRILCLNKVDLVKKKKSLLPLAQEFGQLPGFNRIFMISGLKGGGVKDVKEFLLDQAVIRPWEEEPETVTDMSPPSLAMEIVWEHVLDHLHQELPYELKHEHVSWKVLRDGSVRIEQRLLVPTEAHKKIVVGKRGENIRKIGMAAHAELNERFGQKVHLFLDVKLSSQQMFVPKYETELDLMEM